MTDNLVDRSVRTTFFVGLGAAAALWLLGKRAAALGFLAGAWWNAANLWILTAFVGAALGGARNDRGRILWLAALKFPLLYGAGFLILRSGKVSLYGVLAGFSLLFVVLAGRAIIRPLTPRKGEILRPASRGSE